MLRWMSGVTRMDRIRNEDIGMFERAIERFVKVSKGVTVVLNEHFSVTLKQSIFLIRDTYLCNEHSCLISGFGCLLEYFCNIYFNYITYFLIL